jgi:predicted permease
VNGVLLNPLPFRDPDQLVMITQSKQNFEMGAVPYPNFLDLQKENQTFSTMALSRKLNFGLLGAGESESVEGRLVSADYFTVLDVKPALGRTFMPHEDKPEASPVVVISAALWQRKFGGAADVVGKTVNIDDKLYTIIGVLPPTFSLFRTNDIYVPIGHSNIRSLTSRGAGLLLHGIGRLKPGVSIEQAQTDLNRVMRSLAETYPDTNKGQGAKVTALNRIIVGDIGPVLWMLFGAVGFVLLIACVNVSNLLLSRSTGRTREFAIRSALGANKWQLFRQSLIDSMLLAVVGGALGLFVASWGTRAALALFPATVPRASEVGVDRRVVIFATATSLFAGILAGVAPALKLSGRRLSETLKEGVRRISGARGRAQGALVVVEVALAVVLLIGAGLMIRSIGALWKVDLGFRPGTNLMTFGFSLPPYMRKGEAYQVRAMARELSDRLRSLPGIRAVSFSGGAFPLLAENDILFWRPDQPKPTNQNDMHMALTYRVEPDYLKAMTIPLKRGRFFTYQDEEKSPRVAVIDEVFARKYFGGEDPIGKYIQQEDRDPQQIVGIVGHVNQWSVASNDSQPLQAQLYEPFMQMNGRPYDLTVLVGVDEGSPIPLDAIRRAIHDHNEQDVMSKPQILNDVIANSLADRRFSMILLEVFALVALVLASIGLYGVISYLVGQRTQELGIRLALGAQRMHVLSLILSHGMKLALIGVALGLVAAFGVTRLLANMLYGVSATDPMTFLFIALLVTMVAVLACIVPARRATKVSPLVALRSE